MGYVSFTFHNSRPELLGEDVLKVTARVFLRDFLRALRTGIANEQGTDFTTSPFKGRGGSRAFSKYPRMGFFVLQDPYP